MIFVLSKIEVKSSVEQQQNECLSKRHIMTKVESKLGEDHVTCSNFNMNSMVE